MPNAISVSLKPNLKKITCFVYLLFKKADGFYTNKTTCFTQLAPSNLCSPVFRFFFFFPFMIALLQLVQHVLLHSLLQNAKIKLTS